MKQSAISWTDYSGGDLNFVSGCTPVSEGCANCYARAIYERWGRDHSVVTAHSDKLRRLGTAHWMFRESSKRGGMPMCFVCDTGDLFHDDVDDSFIFHALSTFIRRSDIIWQILTKRPERMRDILGYLCRADCEPLPPGIWLGVTCENQARADERIPILLDIPAAVRFVSVEPMLGPVDLRGNADGLMWPWHEATARGESFNWVICGAESGPSRRPFEVAWAEALYQECKAAGVPFFGKQASGLHPGAPLVLSDGIIHQWPSITV